MKANCAQNTARYIAAIGLLCVLLPQINAQTAHPAAASTVPTITKVDPPDWWIQFPDPMLLVHGEHLDTAHFSLGSSTATLDRTKVSANGHWAFLWLTLHATAPGTISIRAANSAGSATYHFALHQPKPTSAGFAGFSSRDTMYLIMPDRFANGDPSNDSPQSAEAADRGKPRAWHGGDLRGIEQHLDYLQELGITTIWTTPVVNNTPSPESYHGYGATDLYAVDPHFGTLTDYQHLVAAAHARGLKMVFDIVPNHVGPKHPWATDPPTPDWFHGTVANHTRAEGNFDSIVDQHAAPALSRDVTRGWFASLLPDMNEENPLIERYLIQNAIWWVETAGLDGLRIDTFPYVKRAFWHDFHTQLHAMFPRLTTVGEIMNPDPVTVAFFAGGRATSGSDGNIDTGLDTPFDYPTCFRLRRVFGHGKSMRELEAVLRADWLYPHPERLVPFVDNHDVPRMLSEPGGSIAGLKLAIGVLATMRGMPEFYAGDEIAMTGGDDPDNRHDFPGGFPGDTRNAFTESGRTKQEQEVYAWMRQMLTLRQHHEALQTGKMQTVFVDDSAMAYVRAADTSGACDGEQFLVVINNGDQPRTLSLQTGQTALAHCRSYALAVPGEPAAELSGSALRVTLGPRQMALYRTTS